MSAHPPDAALVEDPLRPDVQRHLAACPKCRVNRRLLSSVAVAGPVAPGGEMWAGAQDAARLVDQTTLVPDPLGQHWEVWDRDLGRRVVRVQPPPGVSADHLRAAAATIRRLAHPHLAVIHLVEELPTLTYVRDLVDGGHLGQHDRSRDNRAVAWLAQCASALAVLHEAGLAHGGLVHEAVKITPDGRVVLVGAGIRADAHPRDDWRALAALFDGLPAPLGEVVARLDSADPTQRVTGAQLLAWLLALRDPGAGGGPRYEPRGLLGVGGMGEVRRVYDPLLDRVVAQKVLSGALLANRERVAGFLAEAKITAQLQHPGIVPVHDLESLPNGAVAFTMKQIEGRTMGEVIREVHDASADQWRDSASGWSLRRLVDALRRVCEAISYAHDQGVVHLDLKPGNVMIGGYGEVLVVDWGLARHLGGHAAASAAAGTPGFMAPEQGNGGTDDLGPAADIYALGACLREILDGTPPPGDATETDERPGVGRSRWVPSHPRAPRELVSIVRRAMRADPERRYASARELADDLAAWLEERWVTAHDYRVTEVWRRRLRPHQAPIVVSLLAAVVLLAVGAVGFVSLAAAQETTDQMTAQALVDRANLSFDANDRIRAEAFAAGAVSVADRPDARGLLARLTRGWRPTLVGDPTDVRCREIVVVGEPAMVLCATETGLRAWPLEGGDGWYKAESFHGLGTNESGGWMAVTDSVVVQGDAHTGAQTSQIKAHGTIIDAVSLTAGAVAVAVEREIHTYGHAGSRGAVVRMEADIKALERCGRDTLAVITTPTPGNPGDGLYVVDLRGEGTVTALEADRVAPPLACSDDGRFLAVASDLSVQVWSARRAMQRHILSGHLGDIQAMGWAGDGRTLATASSDGTVRVWDAREGAEIGRISGDDSVVDLAFARTASATDGLVAATQSGGSGSVRHWGLPPVDTVGEFDAVVEVVDLAWSAAPADAEGGGRTLFTVDRLGRPLAFDPDNGRQKMPIFLERSGGASGVLEVGSLAPDASGETVALVSRAGDVGVLDLNEARYLWLEEAALNGSGTAVAWRPGPDALLVSGDTTGAVKAWSLPKDGLPAERLWERGLPDPVAALRWSRDGSVLAARTSEGITLLDAIGGDPPLLELPLKNLAHDINADATLVAVALQSGGVRLVRLPPQYKNVETPGSESEFIEIDVDSHVVGIAFSPPVDGPGSPDLLLATVTREGLVQVFDARTSVERARSFAHPGGATDIAFSLDGEVLAVSGAQGDIVLMDTGPIRAGSEQAEQDVERRYGLSRVATELEFQ